MNHSLSVNTNTKRLKLQCVYCLPIYYLRSFLVNRYQATYLVNYPTHQSHIKYKNILWANFIRVGRIFARFARTSLFRIFLARTISRCHIAVIKKITDEARLRNLVATNRFISGKPPIKIVGNNSLFTVHSSVFTNEKGGFI